MGVSGDTFLDMREAEALQFMDNLFTAADEPLPWVNILTRTHDRPMEFAKCLESINMQNYENINHIVGSDVPCNYCEDVLPLTFPPHQFIPVPNGYYYAPWNLHLNTLQQEVEDGWIMYLDDDDMFVHSGCVTEIMKHITSDDDLIIWKVQIYPNFIVPSHSFGKQVTAGDVSGIGFMYNAKHLPIDWGCISYGDYRAIQQLINKGLNPVWIDQILTMTQNGARNGK